MPVSMTSSEPSKGKGKGKGKGQAQPVLGKREPLAPLDANASSKKRRLTSDSHPEEDHLPTAVKVDDDNDNVDADAPRVGTVRTIGDIAYTVADEDDEEDDVEVVNEQSKQYTDWLRQHESSGLVESLGPDVVDLRLSECELRFRYMLEHLIALAESFSKETFGNMARMPMTFPWFTFFVHMDAEKVLPRLLASLAKSVKVILGGPLTTAELLQLPTEWKSRKFWGVYTDILTNIDGKEEARYCGSSTNKNGMQARLNQYEQIRRGTSKQEPSSHSTWLQKKDVEVNLRVIAVFKTNTPKPYILLMEILGTILLQTLKTYKSEQTRGMNYRTSEALEMVRDATPVGLPMAKHQRLNGAIQCLQGLYYRPHKSGALCANPNCATALDVNNLAMWYAFNPGMPFDGWICYNCYGHRLSHQGKERPAEFEDRRREKDEFMAQVGKEPPVGTACPGCMHVPVDNAWAIPRSEILDEPGRVRWECNHCYWKATADLKANKQTPAQASREALIKGLGGKPPINTRCPRCSKMVTKAVDWSIPLGDRFQGERVRYECMACSHVDYGTPVSDRKTRLRLLDGKPPAGSACPGCSTVVVVNDRRSWLTPAGDFFMLDPRRNRYECRSCSQKPWDKLPNNQR